MKIKEIDSEVFSKFASNHILKNMFQTKEYGDLMSHSEFQIMYVGGYVDNTLVAASLILYKTISLNMKYGYAPRGFLIDYYDHELLSSFTKKLKDFFFKRSFAFIKINPEITYALVDLEGQSKVINSKNRDLIQELKELGYDKLKDNLYFESLLPKFTPVIYLPTYNFDDLEETLVNSMHDDDLSGLRLIKGNEKDIETFYSFVKDKTTKPINYFRALYNSYKKTDKVDLLLLELNYETYVKYLQKRNIYETEKNEKINQEFNDNPNNTDLYNRKMKSDKLLSTIASEISTANNMMSDKDLREILGAALIVKHEGRITLIISGNNNNHEELDVKTFIFYKIIELYKKAGYLFFDMYGITGDYSESNPYKELNKFKLKFKPKVYEYIGEFDLIVNKPFHQLLWSTNQIQKEFYRPAIKK